MLRISKLLTLGVQAGHSAGMSNQIVKVVSVAMTVEAYEAAKSQHTVSTHTCTLCSVFGFLQIHAAVS